LQRARSSLLPDFTRAFSVKFGLVINPIPHYIISVYSFWHIKLGFYELVPAFFVELEFLIAAIIYAEDGVAYACTSSRIQIEGAAEIACFTVCLCRIKTISMEDGVE
jgi:hypothetical protein